jgi:hypothetical protein
VDGPFWFNLVTKKGTMNCRKSRNPQTEGPFFFSICGAKHTMADDKTKRDFGDSDRINRNEEYEVQYWRKELAVSEDRLFAAIEDVGPMVADVKKALRR